MPSRSKLHLGDGFPAALRGLPRARLDALPLDALRCLILDAIARAPSPHNTQPWRVRWIGTVLLELRLEEHRWLRAADPTQRDAWVAIGCAVRNVQVVAAELGLALDWEVKGDAVLLDFAEDSAARPLVPVEAVWARRTNRRPYYSAPLPAELIAALGESAAPFELSTLAGKQTRWLHHLLVDATSRQFADAPVHRELYEWLRLTPGERDRTRDGLSYDALAMDRATAFALRALLHPRAMWLLATAGLHRGLAAMANAAVRQTPQYQLLWSREPTEGPAGFVLAGTRLQAIWLLLAANGWFCHPASAIIDVAATASDLRDRLGIPTEATLLAIYRVGRGGEPAQSLRRAVTAADKDGAPVRCGDEEDAC